MFVFLLPTFVLVPFSAACHSVLWSYPCFFLFFFLTFPVKTSSVSEWSPPPPPKKKKNRAQAYVEYIARKSFSCLVKIKFYYREIEQKNG